MSVRGERYLGYWIGSYAKSELGQRLRRERIERYQRPEIKGARYLTAGEIDEWCDVVDAARNRRSNHGGTA